MELDSLWLVSVQKAVDGYIYAAVVVGLEWLLWLWSW